MKIIDIIKESYKEHNLIAEVIIVTTLLNVLATYTLLSGFTGKGLELLKKTAHEVEGVMYLLHCLYINTLVALPFVLLVVWSMRVKDIWDRINNKLREE